MRLHLLRRVLLRHEGGGRGAFAPPPRTRPGRSAALAVLGAVTLGAWALGTRPGGRSGLARAVPFDPAPSAGVDAAGKPVAVPSPGDRVVLYVSERCPYCALELAAWAGAMRASGVRGPTLVLSPTSPSDDVGYLPEPLRKGWIHDRDGAIARSFGVRAVPFLALLDGQGRVVDARSGLTPPERIRSLLEILRTEWREPL